MKKPTPEEIRKLFEQGQAARLQMQEILDRVEERRQARLARYERRGFLRRLLFP